MIQPKKFYMIRHGESESNAGRYFGGNQDVALTEKGRAQAHRALAIIDALNDKPDQIVHSHLQRARDTASIVNTHMQLPMHETTLVGEQCYGDWEKQPWDTIRAQYDTSDNPPNGESHDDFDDRVKRGINYALDFEGTILIACHGGVFKAFRRLYNDEANHSSVANCAIFSFTPTDHPSMPWKIDEIV